MVPENTKSVYLSFGLGTAPHRIAVYNWAAIRVLICRNYEDYSTVTELGQYPIFWFGSRKYEEFGNWFPKRFLEREKHLSTILVQEPVGSKAYGGFRK